MNDLPNYNHAKATELYDPLYAGPPDMHVCNDLLAEIRDMLLGSFTNLGYYKERKLIEQLINLCDMVKAFQYAYQFASGDLREWEFKKEFDHFIIILEEK